MVLFRTLSYESEKIEWSSYHRMKNEMAQAKNIGIQEIALTLKVNVS